VPVYVDDFVKVAATDMLVQSLYSVLFDLVDLLICDLGACEHSVDRRSRLLLHLVKLFGLEIR
jgi:hypothetical protein